MERGKKKEIPARSPVVADDERAHSAPAHSDFSPVIFHVVIVPCEPVHLTSRLADIERRAGSVSRRPGERRRIADRSSIEKSVTTVWLSSVWMAVWRLSDLRSISTSNVCSSGRLCSELDAEQLNVIGQSERLSGCRIIVLRTTPDSLVSTCP